MSQRPETSSVVVDDDSREWTPVALLEDDDVSVEGYPSPPLMHRSPMAPMQTPSPLRATTQTPVPRARRGRAVPGNAFRRGEATTPALSRPFPDATAFLTTLGASTTPQGHSAFKIVKIVTGPKPVPAAAVDAALDAVATGEATVSQRVLLHQFNDVYGQRPPAETVPGWDTLEATSAQAWREYLAATAVDDDGME